MVSVNQILPYQMAGPTTEDNHGIWFLREEAGQGASHLSRPLNLLKLPRAARV